MIRQATLEDGPRLFVMCLHFLRETPYGAILPENHEAIHALISLVLEHGVGFVAVDSSEEIVGMIGLVERPDPFTGGVYGEEVVWWVEPHARRGSSGPALLKAAEAWARSRGVPFLKMVAPVGGDVGVYYSRLGYQPIEMVYMKRL